MGDNEAGARGLSVARAAFVTLAGLALGCGYLGLYRYLHGPTTPTGSGATWLDLVYYDLQLFVLSSAPLDAGGPYPWPLELARFAAPAATGYALFEAARAVWANEWRRLRTQRLHGHSIVVGDTPLAAAIAARLRGSGRRPVHIGSGDEPTLRAAGLAGASALYACASEQTDGVTNVATALAAARGRPEPAALRVYAHVTDAGLCSALRARRLGLPRSPGSHLDFFNAEEVAARALVGDDDLDGPADIMIVGLGTFGRAVLVEYARQWRLRQTPPARRLAVTLVDPQAGRIAADLAARWDVLADACDLVACDIDLDTVLAGRGTDPYRVFVCYEDEELALRTALTVARLWRGGPRSLVVRLSRLSRYGEAFHQPGSFLLDDLGGRLRLASITELACRTMGMEEDLVDRLAQVIHEHYLLEQVRRGTPLGANEAMTPWPQLSEDKQRASRGQARDIGPKLSTIGAAVAPLTGTDESFTFTRDEIDQLARHEHDRWSAERTAEGWTYHPVRTDAAKHHPSLVPWEQLSESEREKDRDVVRNMPAVLAAVGLQIVRLRA